MLRLAAILYVLLGASLAGTLIVAVLVAGYGTTMPIVWAAVAGFAASVPLSIMIARALYN